LRRRSALADGIGRNDIAAVREVIRPYVRTTPVVEVRGADFGLEDLPVVLKLELLQHSGSFKARGAFANLLTRKIPAAGVVAASGGNHGVAVAYAAMRLAVPARSACATRAPQRPTPRTFAPRVRPRRLSAGSCPPRHRA